MRLNSQEKTLYKNDTEKRYISTRTEQKIKAVYLDLLSHNNKNQFQ